MNQSKHCLYLSLVSALLLAACGGDAVRQDEPAPARADILMQSERGMSAVSADSKNTYLSLTNTNSLGSAVLYAPGPIDSKSSWQPVTLAECGLPVSESDETRRAPKLKLVAGKTLLIQPAWDAEKEHTLCELDPSNLRFAARDKDFKTCYTSYCDMMEVGDVQAVGKRLFANAGGAPNLQVSNDQGTSWRPVMGTMESMACTHQAFHIVGSRLLVGGECPLDMAYLRSYAMNADQSGLASQTPTPVTLPELENRNVQFVTSLTGGTTVFAGVEGGLLRSDDGGRSFKFVIQQPLSGGTGNYVYVTQLLSPANKPNTVVASGFDKAKGLPFVAWSFNKGDTWIDLSSLLPGYKNAPGQHTSQVTSMVEDAQGRILLTVNEQHQAKGSLVALTLGLPR